MNCRMISLAMVMIMLFSIMPAQIMAQEDLYPIITDPMVDSDEYFFGKWDEENNAWITAPQINYGYSQDLKMVELAAKAGQYDMASLHLRDYYRNKNIDKKIGPGGVRNSLQVEMWCDNIFYWDEDPVGIVEFDTQLKWRSIDITNAINSNIQTFMMFSRQKSSGTAYVYSKESEYKPYIKMNVNGNEVVITPSHDTYISAGINKATNYGSETILKVADDADTGTDIWADESTYRAYLRFSIMDYIDRTDEITSAKLYLYGNSDCDNNRVVVSAAAFKTPEESGFTWEKHTPSTFCLGNYDGWTVEGVHSRFYQILYALNEYYYSGNEKYAYHSIRQVVDFSKYRRSDFYQDLQVGIRLSKLVPAYLNFVHSPNMSASASTAFLKLMLYDAKFLYDDKNFTDNMNYGSNATKGYYTFVIYFPEFADQNLWLEKVHERVLILMKNLVHDDGTYYESDYGYALTTLSAFVEFHELAKQEGWEIPDWYYEKLRLFGYYFINGTMPNGNVQDWGDNGAGKADLSSLVEILDDPYINYFASNGKDGIKPYWLSSYAPDNHVGIMRNNFLDPNAVYAFCDNKQGGIHSHREGIHFVIMAYGNYLLTDTGCSSYNKTHPHFNWQRFESISHNTIVVNNAGSAGYHTKPEIDALSDEEMYINPLFDTFEAWSDAIDGAGNFRHYRDITYIKPIGMFIVSDMVEAKTGNKENKYNQAWHTLADADLSLDESSKKTKTNFNGLANLQIVPLDPEELNLEHAAYGKQEILDDGYAYYSNDDIRNCVEAKFVNYQKFNIGNTTFDTVLYPNQVGDKTDVLVERLDTGVDKSFATAFKILLKNNQNAKDAFYLLNRNSKDSFKQYKFGDYSSDGRFTYIQRNNEQKINAIMLRDASKVTVNGQELFNSLGKKIPELSIAFNEGVVEIFGEDIENIPLKIYLPDGIFKVKLNGKETPFHIIGDMMYLGADEIELNRNINENNKIEILTNLIKLNGSGFNFTIPNGTTLFSDDWNCKVSLPRVVNGNVGSYGIGKLFDFGINVTFSKPALLVINDLPYSEVYYLDGNEYKPIDKKQDEISVDFSNGNTIISLKKTYQIGVVPKNKTSPNNNEGHNGGKGGLAPSFGRYAGSIDTVERVINEIPMPDKISNKFVDIEGHWAKNNILLLTEEGVVNGKSEEIFAPDEFITRAELAAIIMREFQLPYQEYKGEFSDVSSEDWFADAVKSVLSTQIFVGHSGLFRPNDPVTRAEAAKVAILAYEYKNQTDIPIKDVSFFKDSSDIPQWSVDFIGKIFGIGAMRGMPDGKFYPNNPLTRAEAVTIICNIREI